MMFLDIKTNINVVAGRFNRLPARLVRGVGDWAEQSGNLVARRAVESPNMIRGGTRRFPNTPGPLRRQSGRLATSLKTKNQESLSYLKTNENSGEVIYTRGSKVPYARVHEIGTAYLPTRRQGGFFSAQGRLDSNVAFRPIWRALARKARERRPIIVPARPYLGPALDQNEARITGNLRTRIDQVFAKYY